MTDNPLTETQPDAHLSALLDKCLHETVARVRARGDATEVALAAFERVGWAYLQAVERARATT